MALRSDPECFTRVLWHPYTYGYGLPQYCLNPFAPTPKGLARKEKKKLYGKHRRKSFRRKGCPRARIGFGFIRRSQNWYYRRRVEREFCTGIVTGRIDLEGFCHPIQGHSYTDLRRGI